MKGFHYDHIVCVATSFNFVFPVNVLAPSLDDVIGAQRRQLEALEKVGI